MTSVRTGGITGMGTIGGRQSDEQDGDWWRHEPSTAEPRALAAESAERRRIGQALHDGPQGRLVVLRVALSRLIDLLESDPPEAVRLARRLENEAQDAIDELRAVVHGLHPPVLTDFGLAHALQDIARSLPVRVRIVTQGIQRYDSAVEDAVFFTCREALHNTIKHARGATVVTLTLIDDGNRLEFGVEDDGAGFDAALPGNGFATMHHRIEAMGGSLTITSSPSVGTRVEGSIAVRSGAPG